MRILYIDIDSLRPDHLGCYGYHRDTSPNIDSIAEDAVRFENCYAADTPCLPSRTGLWSGRCGFHTGVVGHGGTAGQPFIEGPTRGFRDLFDDTGWMRALRRAGLKTATVSSFGERHAAWHWYAGYNEIFNPGYRGMDRADQVTPYALDWLNRNGQQDNWFLHVNYWDPHTPFRTPEEFGNPFANDPLPDFINEEMWQRGFNGYGPHSPQEPNSYGSERMNQYFPRHPDLLDSMEAVRQWVDNYDVGVRYADDGIGQLMNTLADLGILDDTIVIVSADHGENIGELNVWGDHQTADEITCNVPLIIRWPGMEARVDSALHYHYDWAATLIEMVDGEVPDNWDGVPFTDAFRAGRDEGRDYLVVSQGAWACQRSVRFVHDSHDYICLNTYHDGYKMLEPVMLFDLTEDPHETNDLSESHPTIVDQAMGLLADWYRQMMLTATKDVDPLMTVMREGGPFHTRGRLPEYLKHLRNTGRAHHAEKLEALHPEEAKA